MIRLNFFVDFLNVKYLMYYFMVLQLIVLEYVIKDLFEEGKSFFLFFFELNVIYYLKLRFVWVFFRYIR